MTGDILTEGMPEPSPPGDGLPLFRVPWMDPGYAITTSWFRFNIVPVVPGTPTLVAKANSKRWAVGFGMNGAAAAVNQVRFDNNQLVAAPFIVVGPATLWLYIFQHGPLVSTDLWVMSSGITNVGLTEILIQ